MIIRDWGKSSRTALQNSAALCGPRCASQALASRIVSRRLSVWLRFLPAPGSESAGTNRHQQEGASDPGRGFGNGRDGGVLETDLHIEIVPAVDIAAQGVSAIGVAPEVEFVAVVLGEQQAVFVQERIGSGILRIAAAKIHGVVVNVGARRRIEVVRIRTYAAGGIKRPEARCCAASHVQIAAASHGTVVGVLDVDLSDTDVPLSVVEGDLIQTGAGLVGDAKQQRYNQY